MSICSNINDPVNEPIEGDSFEKNVNFVTIYDIFAIKSEKTSDWLTGSTQVRSWKLSHSLSSVFCTLTCFPFETIVCIKMANAAADDFWWWSITISQSESARFAFATWGPWLGSSAPHWHVYSTRSGRVSLNAPSPFMPRAVRYWKKLGPSFTCGYNYSRWSAFSKMPYRKVESFSL